MNILNCGVYKIENLINNMMYIGGSANLQRREYDHFYKLKYSKHKNPNLQLDYNKYGKNVFKFTVLLYCEPFECKRYEQFLVDKYRPSKLLYNICLDDVCSNLGVYPSQETKLKISKNHADFSGENHPLFGKHHSEESRKKNSEAHKGKNNYMWGKRHSETTHKKMIENHADNSGENHPMWGKHYSPEEIKKLRKSSPTIMKKEMVLRILRLLEEGMTQTAIAVKLNINRKTVFRAKNGDYDDIYDISKKRL